MNRGHYYHSPKEYERVTGRRFTEDCPSAGPYPSVRGMRKHYWGYERDVVRHGAYCYLQPIILN